MAKFEIVKELASLERDQGLKRMLLALYSSGENGSGRYIALSEQIRPSKEDQFVSIKKGITIRRGEVAAIISALQSADFDAKSDGNGLSDREYSKLHVDWA
jgi:hypothetical protein